MAGHHGDFGFVLGSRGGRHNLMWPVPHGDSHGKGCAPRLGDCRLLAHAPKEVTLVPITCVLL